MNSAVRNFRKPLAILNVFHGYDISNSIYARNLSSKANASKVNPGNDQYLKQLKAKMIDRFNFSNEQANIASLRFLNSDLQNDINDNHLDERFQLLQKTFKHEDLCHNLKILSIPNSEIQCKINILTELGFDQLEIKLLDSLQYLMSQTLIDLKKNGLYPVDKNPWFSIVDSLKSKSLIAPDEKLSCTLANSIDSLSLREIRSKCLQSIIQKILNCSEQVASHIVETLNHQRNLDRTSFINLITNLQIFTDKINLPINYLIKYFTLLTICTPENLLRLWNIEQFQEDSVLRGVFFTRQRMLQIDSRQIEDRIRLLIDTYNCTTTQLANCVAILELTTTEITEKFDKFKQSKQLEIYSNNDDLLRLVLNIDSILVNISSLEERDISIKYITLSNLLKSNNKFLQMLNNNDFKLTLDSFTNLHFGNNLKEIRNKIGTYKVGNQALNSINAECIVNFFRRQALTDEQIINGIYLVYFDFKTVQTVWDEVFDFAEIRQSKIEWKTHPNVLQLLFYFIEKLNKS